MRARGPFCVQNTVLLQMSSCAAELSDLGGQRTFLGYCFSLKDGHQRQSPPPTPARTSPAPPFALAYSPSHDTYATTRFIILSKEDPPFPK